MEIYRTYTVYENGQIAYHDQIESVYIAFFEASAAHENVVLICEEDAYFAPDNHPLSNHNLITDEKEALRQWWNNFGKYCSKNWIDEDGHTYNYIYHDGFGPHGLEYDPPIFED